MCSSNPWPLGFKNNALPIEIKNAFKVSIIIWCIFFWYLEFKNDHLINPNFYLMLVQSNNRVRSANSKSSLRPARKSINHLQTSPINQSTHGPHSLKWVNHLSQDFLNICSALQFHIHLNHEKCFQRVIYETREQRRSTMTSPKCISQSLLFK